MSGYQTGPGGEMGSAGARAEQAALSGRATAACDRPIQVLPPASRGEIGGRAAGATERAERMDGNREGAPDRMGAARRDTGANGDRGRMNGQQDASAELAAHREALARLAEDPGCDDGLRVLRRWGGSSAPEGRSWTTDPANLHSRNRLGVGDWNTAEFISDGVATNKEGITTRRALPTLSENPPHIWFGGGRETLIPQPHVAKGDGALAPGRVELKAVTMPDAPLPDSLPTDPYRLPRH